MTKGIWISWEKQRRNKGIALALGWPLFEFDIKASFSIRYFLSTMKTLRLIAREKPRIVVAQNPSIILCIWVTLLSRIWDFVFIMDAHNAGIFPMEGNSKLLMLIAKWLQKQATFTIVTNPGLERIVYSNGGNGICLPDALPLVPATKKKKLEGNKTIAFICTYSQDEPFQEVFEAAKMIDPTIMIYTTGKFAGKVDQSDVFFNIRLLGFLSEEEFWDLLSSVDIIMDLTTRENCLVCGAYEAVALGKPLILSNTKALRTYFNKGCIYVDPNRNSIAKGITAAVENVSILKRDIADLHAEITFIWENAFKNLVRSIDHDLFKN